MSPILEGQACLLASRLSGLRLIYSPCLPTPNLRSSGSLAFVSVYSSGSAPDFHRFSYSNEMTVYKERNLTASKIARLQIICQWLIFRLFYRRFLLCIIHRFISTEEIMSLHIHRVYTKIGDDGLTQLMGSPRVPKHSLPIECLGACDELCAFIGMISIHLKAVKTKKVFSGQLIKLLTQIQNDVFDIGYIVTHLKLSAHDAKSVFPTNKVDLLEKWLDTWSSELPPLMSFILGGGGILSGSTHVARTICRKTERLFWAYQKKRRLPLSCLKYLNRLSDFLFVLARKLSVIFHENETLWNIPKIPHRKK